MKHRGINEGINTDALYFVNLIDTCRSDGLLNFCFAGTAVLLFWGCIVAKRSSASHTKSNVC